MYRDVFKTEPAVFAVGNTYQIMVPVNCGTLMWVKIGDKCFYDHANGTMRSATSIHRMIVPQNLLDKEKKYSVCYRVVKERKPYFTETEDEQAIEYRFNPIVGVNAKAFLIADTHNGIIPAVCAAKQFEKKYGEIDFLIMNGDVTEDSGCIENFETIYQIAGQITKGTKPIAYAKGNHDLRGICAEKMEEYTPSFNGKSYFTFRIGDIWGISLDCGEDKEDNHAEYGHTVCCHDFRLEETEYIKDVIKNASDEYLAEGVKKKIIVVHNSFSEQLEPPFDIEKELYTEWGMLLREDIKPDVMICGHFHRLAINNPGCESDHLGQPCQVVIGTKPTRENDVITHYIGTGIFFDEKSIEYVFIDDQGKEYIVE